MRVAICEDSQTSLQYYEYLLTVASEKHEIFIELSTFENGNELLFYLDGDGPPFDLIYLDVQMPKWDGVSVANELRNNMDYKGEIIFLTSHKESAVAGYEVHAYQYLLKNDTDRNRFEAVFLEVAKKIRQNKKQHLLLKGNGEFRNVEVESIYYFEINQKKVTVHYGRGETFSFYMSLAELEEQLAPYACYRVHRSYIIKLSNVMRKVASSLLMANGDNIPIGRTYVQSVKAFIDSNENAVV